MADYCKQCSEELFGQDNLELANLVTKEDVSRGMFAIVICEGCTGNVVDHLGRCLDPSCDKHGSDADRIMNHGL